jgi:hypothetical protein
MSKISIGKQFLSKSFGVSMALVFVALMVFSTISAGTGEKQAILAEEEIKLPNSAVQETLELGTAANFAILSKTGITTTGTTTVVGNIGVSPAAGTDITGFSLEIDLSGKFATSIYVTGKIYAADYADPTPSMMTTAISDMETAYNNAAGRATPDFVELGAGDISGLTLVPGLYKWDTGVIIPSDVTLDGSATDIWIFQISQTLVVSSGVQVLLTGGALKQNIFWQVGGQTTLGTTSVFCGNILCQTSIVMDTGATLNGRALAQAEVTLDANTVVGPPESVQTPDPDATPIDEEDNEEPKVDGYPFLAIGVVFLGTVGLIAIIKRKHVLNA